MLGCRVDRRWGGEKHLGFKTDEGDDVGSRWRKRQETGAFHGGAWVSGQSAVQMGRAVAAAPWRGDGRRPY